MSQNPTVNMAAAVGVPYAGPMSRRGSPLRGGKSAVCAGANVSTIAAGATETLTFEFSELLTLGKLHISGITDAATRYLSVTSIKIRGDELLGATEEVHALMYAHDSIMSPAFGHTVDPATKVTVTIKNNDGTNASGPVFAGFSVA